MASRPRCSICWGLADHDLDLHLVTEARSPEALANLARLDPRIRVIHRETFPMRATEAAALRRFQTDNDLSDPVLETQIRALFTREARRLLAGGYSMPRWISAAIRGNGRR
ncbi:hypothetical protein ACFSHQ_27870 [Gemmobacter lanyuensis]